MEKKDEYEKDHTEKDTMELKINVAHHYIYMKFSSRVALHNFARSLLDESLNENQGFIEFYHLSDNDKTDVVNGTRLSKDSPRLFVEYPTDD
ncbi:hypothetical protein [Isobaculum melis]|uniref:Uncharacterized protein n=1 Tax=Isobaculum melis TaxID=142588 RepID=A0A1H9RTS4_9LACT|nr:hypothetical protein [Isobaculum melis]SER75339.1 hypothetical protein SAMN04488559_10522 [Isobaculum melis]